MSSGEEGAAACEEDEPVMFTNARGQKLRRWTLPDITNPVAVCILVHGVGDHVLTYKRMAQAFSEKHNIALHLFDQVGHGRSEGTRVDITDYKFYEDDLIQFVDMVKAENSTLPLFVIGYSMGGLVLGRVLLRKPDLCNGVVMYAAAIDADPKVATPFKLTLVRMLSYLIPSFPISGLRTPIITRNLEEMKRLEADPLRYQGKMKARWGYHTLNAIIDFNTRMSEISIPIFIVHGGADEIVRVTGSQTLNDSITSQDKTLKIYENCHHRIHVEPDGDGERFVEDLALWILERVK